VSTGRCFLHSHRSFRVIVESGQCYASIPVEACAGNREVRNDERQIASQLHRIEAIHRRGKVLATFSLREAQRGTSGTIQGQSASVNNIVAGPRRGVDPRLRKLITRRWTPGCEEWTGDETVGNMKGNEGLCDGFCLLNKHDLDKACRYSQADLRLH